MRPGLFYFFLYEKTSKVLTRLRRKSMLLDELVNRCYNRDMQRDRTSQCLDCTYGKYCTGDCQECLKNVHFQKGDRPHREYDCQHMADCYYCKYAYRYASEIVYGLSCFKDILDYNELNVLSVGCGPCTDLAGIDFLRNTGELNFSRLNYVGVDPLANVWKPIWDDILRFYDVEIIPQDIFQYVDYLVQNDWVPDVIIFQYVFSDMRKNSDREQILRFIDKIVDFVNNQKKPICILCNDINLTADFGGGINFFNDLAKRISNPKNYVPAHFNNSNRENHYEYGEQYPNNSLVFDGIPEEIMRIYNPYTSCASAQMLIERL